MLCDVLPMHATHLVLRRPCQFDRKAKHDGFKKMYSLEKEGRIYTLASLTPKQVYENEIQLKKSYKEKALSFGQIERTSRITW